MQLLYVNENTENTISPQTLQIELHKQFGKTRELFVYLIHFLIEVARYAEVDAKHRASKNITTQEDLNVNIKIAGNDILWQILENPSYQKVVEEDKPERYIDADLIKRFYLILIETPEYVEYVAGKSRERKKDREILEFLFNVILLPNEIFQEHVEDCFNNWEDDAEMLQQLVNNVLQKSSQDIHQIISNDKWQFAKSLLATVSEKKTYLMELIKPKLKNWDMDRVAVLDLILIQMGICEFLYFETIPTKVTINEYIDLAKEYSTLQSGQFVNGILDSIHKDLLAEGKIEKIDFNRKAH